MTDGDAEGRLNSAYAALLWKTARADMGLCRWCGHPMRRQTFLHGGFLTDPGVELCPYCDQEQKVRAS